MKDDVTDGVFTFVNYQITYLQTDNCTFFDILLPNGNEKILLYIILYRSLLLTQIVNRYRNFYQIAYELRYDGETR